jgi:DNA-binding transcriptional regulator LsrR (DeoR family)
MLPGIAQRNMTEGSLLADDRFLRKIAYMYYVDGKTQEDIASMLYCSRQTIGKALQKARERRIVHISVIPEDRTGYLRNLSRDLRFILELEDLVLVPGRSMDALAPDEVIEDINADIATTAADYLDHLITDRDILAVSGGRTIMRNVVRYLKPSKLLSRLEVVPTIGFVETRPSIGDSNLVAYDIATAYGAKHSWLPIPAIVETPEQQQQARSLPLVRDVIKTMERANIIMLGVWPAGPKNDLVKRRVVTQQQLETLEALQPVGDINHWVFDATGRFINDLLQPPPYYLTGLEIPLLKKRVQQERIKVILVAGASRSYVPVIRALLKAGIVNILITDHVTAERLKTEIQAESGREPV